MSRRLALAFIALGLTACGSSLVATRVYESSAGYRVAYPADWNVRSATAGGFSARAADGREYLAVIRLDGSPGLVVGSHREELARISDRLVTRQISAGAGSVTELWSSRTETDGKVGIYQQYFVAVGAGTLWLQHGCVEHGPEAANESADRDCDDAGLAILNSLVLT
jgi:hypothetical protein